MTKDLIIAKKKKRYPVHLTFIDGTSFSGEISLTSNKSHVKIQIKERQYAFQSMK